MKDIDAVLTEQVAYYRARAPEYDEWWQRTGRHYHSLTPRPNSPPKPGR